MATANYTPGTWLGLLRSRTAVFLGPETPPALVQSLWELLEDAPEVHEVLHAVTSSFGVSLAQIPSFGIVDYRDALRVFLRGDLDLTVQLPGGPVELNGRDVTTWAERRLDRPEWYRLTVAGETRPGPALPLAEGVVLLQSLTVALAVTLTGEPAAAAVVLSPVGLDEPAEPEAGQAPAPAVERGQDAGFRLDGAGEVGAEVERDRHGRPGTDTPDYVGPDMDPAPDTDTDLEADAVAGPGREVSAETVMGLDDDAHYPAETPGPGQEAEPGERLDNGLSQGAVPALHADQVPAHELTGTYDHLWEKTVVRRIEDAAVRDEPEGGDAGPVLQEAAPAADAGTEASGLPDVAYAPGGLNDVPPAPAQPPAPAAVPANGLGGGLIDSVPWRTAASGAPAAAPPVPPPFLPPAQASEPGSADPAGFEGDHDGHTIMKNDLAGMAAHQAPAPEPDAGTGPLVLALVCGRGHANPPTRAQCAACSLPLPADAVQVARPRLGRMRVSTGELVDLDQSLVVGRQPAVSRVHGGGMPRLVQVSSPSGDISRSHVEVRLEGWHVMLCDLKATNGTVLVREGQQPRRLAQNEMAILLDGDIAELGDDISLRFEEIL